MRKKRMALVAAMAMTAVAGPFSTAASADPDCYGVTSFPDTYVCVVRSETPGAQVIPQGPGILMPSVCAGDLGCTQESWIYLPDVSADGGLVVVFYNGNCYYIEDGELQPPVAAASADDCP